MTTIDMGDGYFLKASKEQIGSFKIVAIDLMHQTMDILLTL